MAKIAFLDVETTGKYRWKHAVHQIGIIIEVDGKVMEQQQFDVRPHLAAQIDKAALDYCGITRESVLAKPPLHETIIRVKSMLCRYCDLTDPLDKYQISGYHCAAFDIPFLEAWFAQCGDGTFSSLFWNGSLDVIVLAAQHLREQRSQFNTFSLKAISKYLGIHMDPAKAHSALYDAQIAREVYNILTNGTKA